MKTEEICLYKLQPLDLVMHKDGSLFIIVKVDFWNKTVIIHREGGGFQYIVPIKKFMGDFTKKITKYTPKMTKEFVSIDNEDPKPCKADRHNLWNGWAKPYFKKKVAIQILREFDIKIVKIKRKEIHYYDGDWEYVEILRKGKYGYPLGAGSWIWSFN